jgi:3-hydroxyacyl-[acyl-carrier-protein] dehydratase
MSISVTDLIPHRPPFLFIDEIITHDEVSLSAQREWRSGEDFYQGHYPNAPITPGVLMCESVFQAGAAYMALKARAGGDTAGEGVPLLAKISDVRFRNPVFPGETTIITVQKKEEMGGFIMMSGAVKKADGTRVLTVNFSVAWKTPASK